MWSDWKSLLLPQVNHPVVQAGSGPRECGEAVSVDEALAAEAARYAAQMNNDFAAMERLYGDDLVYIHSSTAVDTKASFIESMRSGTVRYRKMTLGDVTVRTPVRLVAGHPPAGQELTVRGWRAPPPARQRPPPLGTCSSPSRSSPFRASAVSLPWHSASLWKNAAG
jgi:hypothetical protein